MMGRGGRRCLFRIPVGRTAWNTVSWPRFLSMGPHNGGDLAGKTPVQREGGRRALHRIHARRGQRHGVPLAVQARHGVIAGKMHEFRLDEDAKDLCRRAFLL
jgi:hypothetical protein